MRTGVSYLPPHNPRHIRTDLRDIRALGCDDVLAAYQENDAVYFTGKIDLLPAIAREEGLRPIAIFWGGLNFFGGGRSSQFLLAHPEAHQVMRDDSWHAGGCYLNPICLGEIRAFIDRIAHAGFAGFFVDEPSLMECHCAACRDAFARWYEGDLASAPAPQVAAFRRRSVLHYIETITDYIRATHPRLETMCCLMPSDRDLWTDVAALRGLDCLGTDLYWANDARDLEEMRPYVREMAALCRKHGKVHQEWFQCWGIAAGNEERAAAQARLLASERPDALYTWAFNAQLGTSESCSNPTLAWSLAAAALRAAKL